MTSSCIDHSCDQWGESMQKRYKTIQQFHDLDPEILFSKYERKHFRVGLLSETSSDVVFTSIIRNILVVDLSGTKKHLTRMDGIFDETPTQPGDVCLVPPGLEVRLAWIVSAERTDNITGTSINCPDLGSAI